MRRPSPRSYPGRHAAVALTVLFLAVGYWVARSIQQLLRWTRPIAALPPPPDPVAPG